MSDQAELTRPATRGTLQTVNPATGEHGRSYELATIGEAHSAAAAAHRAFRDWRRTAFADRSDVIRKAAAILRERQDELARLMTEEMGKTLDEGRADLL